MKITARVSDLPYNLPDELVLRSENGLEMRVPTAIILVTLRDHVSPADLRQIRGLDEFERYELMMWARDQLDHRTPEDVAELLDAIEAIATE